MRNPPSCYFPSFLFASLTRFVNNPDSSRHNYFHDIIQFFIRNYQCCKTRSEHFRRNRELSVAAAAAVNPNGIKTFLPNSLSTFPIKGNPVDKNGRKSVKKSS